MSEKTVLSQTFPLGNATDHSLIILKAGSELRLKGLVPGQPPNKSESERAGAVARIREDSNINITKEIL